MWVFRGLGADLYGDSSFIYLVLAPIDYITKRSGMASSVVYQVRIVQLNCL